MNTLYKYIALICLSLNFAYAQRSDSDMIKFYSDKRIHKDQFSQKDYQKHVIKKAQEGDAKSQFYCGSYLMNLAKTKADSLEAFNWIERSSNQGYNPAIHEIGFCYKYGLVVPYDLNMALIYFEKVAQTNDFGLYSTGYMKYLGQGCKQDYHAAFKDFNKGAISGGVRCMYMLGLCYKNGFGVGKDETQAKLWLEKAAQNGDSQSQSELSIVLPEVNDEIKQYIAKNSTAKKLIENSTIHTNQFNEIINLEEHVDNAVYEGYWLKYDWSGEIIVDIKPIDLAFKNTDKGYDCDLLFKGDQTHALFNLQEQDNSTLTGGNVIVDRDDRYFNGNDEKIIINEMQLTFKKTQEGDYFLAGEVKAYSPIQKENERPIKLLLQKRSTDIKMPEKQELNFSVSPNPFTNRCNLEFFLTEPSLCQVLVHDISGRMVFETAQISLSEGTFIFPLEADIQSGTYFVTMVCNNNSKTLKLVKI